jgi:hypothetical protein
MKIIKKLFVVAFISIAAFACSSDDDNSGTTEVTQAKLIGTWKFTSSTTNGVLDTDFYTCDFEDTYEISATSITITYYWDPSGEDGSNCELDGTYAFNYSINGNTLSNDEGESTKVLTLNDTTLVFEDTEVYEGTTYVYTETFTKQ